jgi:hypothetical protein
MIEKQSKVGKIRLNYNYEIYKGADILGFEFLNKEGESILLYGIFDGVFNKEFSVEDNEQVIGIKAQTVENPASRCHGMLYNLQFKIAKLI